MLEHLTRSSRAGAYWPTWTGALRLQGKGSRDEAAKPHPGGVDTSMHTALKPAVGGNGVLAATVEALSGTLGLRDGPTGAHSGRVGRLSSALGRRLHLA